MEDFLENFEGFIWDTGNHIKNVLKHSVSNEECEAIFVNRFGIVFDDVRHSIQEARYIIIGPTGESRILTISFTIRNNFVRVISARDASRKERKIYEETFKTAQI